ncbi:MAG TPA: pentapeptide repeat-containing protein [Ktedonobacteraceae bacterium]|nr:pentapeptide repeat-containing protein [Ktedonobacteraceae bacterium]
MSKPGKRFSVLAPLFSFLLGRQAQSSTVPSEQAKRLLPVPTGLLANNRDAWHLHWVKQGQPWRWEPEISAQRQQELNKRRAIVPDIKKGIYPFRGVKLSRADVEWLLATHEDGLGPVDWNDESQRDRLGLDLRGADLREVNLRGLPMACMLGSLRWDDWKVATVAQRDMAAIHLEGATLRETHLERARLNGAYLAGASFRNAYLEDIHLLQAHLEGADFFRAHLESASLREAYLQGADLRLVYFDHASSLDNMVLGDEKFGFISMVDVHWGDVNLSVINWASLKMLGNESVARHKKSRRGRVKGAGERIEEYQVAVRANRQLAVVLENQGLSEDAARFAYRAQFLQRKVLWKQREFGKWFFSLLLALLAGYGYRMWRIIAAYLIIVSLCALAYFLLGFYYAPHLPLQVAFLESITAFHGRVFSGLFASNTPQIWVTAFEAIAGLVIEGVFIAMLTQRFFGK